MAWIEAARWTFNPPGNAAGKGNLQAVMMYDDSSVTLTTVTVKFYLTMINGLGSYDYFDTFFLLFNPESSSRTIYGLKTRQSEASNSDIARWPYDPGTLYVLKKGALDSAFSLPPFWFCNRGLYGAGSTADSLYSVMVNNSVGYKYYQAIGGATYALKADSSVATAGTPPVVAINDHLNNICTITGTLGKSGKHNKLLSATLYHTIDGSNPMSSNTVTVTDLEPVDGNSFSKTINITRAITVKARVVCRFLYNTESATDEKSVTYWALPNAPGKPELTEGSFKNKRLTIRQDWHWQWAAPADGKDPAGYRIYLFKNNAAITGIAAGANNTLIKGSGSTNYIDRDSSSTRLSFDPTDFGFKAKDTVKLGIYAYTKNGIGEKLFNGRGNANAQVVSDVYTVENAGVVNVKVGNAWTEGQVYVKANNEWKEAETVSVKTSNGWKESE